ncbi:hypothetical protein ABL78_7269 [Leptomonas seymouri]|uniref:Uncharacterized protein n=1 Tax=Leptomonas seymouri TaxID=5684 RepID=A0A0N0P3H7_LEPSE|nr:hypothetical protein ABL78_7269 [Leptomonas seymouri]|eukprot:KPI83687.1 hypothetical protein ABL78_7269 [Leptomonas seymouri]
MFATPHRSPSSVQATRRVSFSPAADAVQESSERRRLGESHGNADAEPANELSHRKHSWEPGPASHPTRLASSYGPARCQAPGSAVPPSEDSFGPTATTTVEFSVKDIPLNGKMPPPVWCEPSPSRGNTSQRVSPRRGGTPVSATLSTTLSHNGALRGTSPTAARLSNPYTDLARDNANLLRRQRVVRVFFESHEDAVRLYIRLQQLLSFRDVYHVEFQQRLQFLSSEEERQDAVAARAQRMAAQEREIKRIQDALAKADVTSPEFSSSMNSLYSEQSGALSERSARRDEAAENHASPLSGNDGAEALAGDVQRRHRGSTVADAVEGQRQLTSLRQASPRKALEAWSRSRAQGKAKSTESISLEEAHRPSAHRGDTPQDREAPSCTAMLSTSSAEHAGGVTTVVKAQQNELSSRRQAAPCGITDSAEARPSKLGQMGGDRSSSLPSTSRTGAKDSAARAAAADSAQLRLHKAAMAATPGSGAPSYARGSLPLLPASPVSRLKPQSLVAGLVTPIRAAHSPQAGTATPHLEDSPLARFRRRQGYQDPVEGLRARLPNSATPLRSRLFHGAADGSPAHREGLRDSPESNSFTGADGQRRTDERAAVPRQRGATPRLSPGNRAAPKTGVTTPEKQPFSAEPAAHTGAEQTPSMPRAATRAADVNAFTVEVDSSAPQPPPRGSSHEGTPTSYNPSAPTRRGDRNSDNAKSPSKQEFSVALPPFSSTPPPAKGPVAAVTADIQSWSPADPPIAEVGLSIFKSGSDARLVPSQEASQLLSEPQRVGASGGDGERSRPHRTPHRPVKAASTPSPPADTSICDEMVAVELRVGALERRTAELERNAAKRAVLDAIQLLRERVSLLEYRTLVLESNSDDTPLSDRWQWRRN